MPTNTDFRENNPANRPDLTQPVAMEQVALLPRKNGKFSHAAFIYDAAQDRYYCPAGQPLLPKNKCKYHRTKIGYTKYQCPGCAQCPLAKQCVTEKATVRTVQRDEYQAYRERTGKRMATPEGSATYSKRAPVVEGVFAVIKHIMKIRRFLLRGLDKVRIEWHWICGAYNLKRLLNLMTAANNGPDKTNSRPKYYCTGEQGHFWVVFCVLSHAAAIIIAVKRRRHKACDHGSSTNRIRQMALAA